MDLKKANNKIILSTKIAVKYLKLTWKQKTFKQRLGSLIALPFVIILMVLVGGNVLFSTGNELDYNINKTWGIK